MVWTKYVFPSIRIFIWAIIAVALVKLAFGVVPTDAETTPEIIPGSDFSAEAHTVGVGEIVSKVVVNASVVQDPSVEVKAIESGTVGYWAVNDGASVVKGQAIVEIRKPIMSQREEDEDGNVIEPYDTGRFSRHTVFSPIDGVVKFVAELDSETTKSTVVFSVNPGTLSIEGDLSPKDRYRLVENPKNAKIDLDGGPDEFTCKKVQVGSDVVTAAFESGTEWDDETGEEVPATSEGNAVKLKCPAPKKVRLFAGLTGTMTITAGKVEDVVVVPVTAVQSNGTKGKVWAMDAVTGEETEREIVLGLSDGEIIEVTEGLTTGDTIRQYAPGNMEEMQAEMGAEF